MNHFTVLFAGVLAIAFTQSAWVAAQPDFASPEERELADLINEYRQHNGLPPVVLSPSLTFVAQTHSRDLVEHPPDASGQCNLHSWSDQGSWSPCCYTPDHAQSQCMWNKPRELTAYTGNGFEISAESSVSISPQAALDLWKQSPAHDDVILNRSIWAEYPWGAMGVGIVGGYANVWFGVEADPAQ